SESTMKKILIVDDDKNFLASLIEGLDALLEDVAIFIAHGGDEAFDVLSNENIDLLVTDLNMPKTDGFVLLSYMSKHHPNTRIIVMTAYGSAGVEERVYGTVACQYIEKPIEVDQLKNKIQRALSESVSGYIRGISVPAFLQLLEMDRKTCVLIVDDNTCKGKLFFAQGHLFDAEVGELRGEDAALEIIAWENAAIEIGNLCNKREVAINKSVPYLIMESLQRKDEIEHSEQRSCSE
ncbi:MAG: response regulator, partial [Desulfuromonadales bacterium]|nr:response regulator [Desulfuromonadales bacterium]